MVTTADATIPRSETRSAGVGALGLLALALALVSGAAAAASAGQLVLDSRTETLRLWSPSLRPTEVRLPSSYRAHTAIEAEGGQVVAGVDAARGDLFFLHRAGGSTRDLPSPPGRTEGLRSWPVLLASRERLDGAVWLEGADAQSFAIRAAAWNGTSWEAGELVSRSRGRPQLAPGGAVLSDGSWLVVWAGYDGNDDEIYWSRRVDGIWSAPRRLHPGNRVPDILPSIAAHGDGARVAWSFFDGNDYRVKIAAWDGAAWRIEGVADGLGAVDTGWQTSGDRAFVTFHSVVPDGWTVIEVDLAGAMIFESHRAGAAVERPVVQVTGSSRPRLVFPQRER